MNEINLHKLGYWMRDSDIYKETIPSVERYFRDRILSQKYYQIEIDQFQLKNMTDVGIRKNENTSTSILFKQKSQ